MNALRTVVSSVIVGAASLACGVASPANDDEPLRSVAEPVIVDDDGRRELYEIESTAMREALADSAIALVWAHRVHQDEGRVTLGATTLQDSNACEDERFAEQPAAAFCSGVLIDDDLVLTAGHCLGFQPMQADDVCSRVRLVFDYHYESNDELALESVDSVHSCRRVVYHQRSHSEDDFVDIAVLQLDRAATDRTPAPVASDALAVGDALTVATHGAGLPLKVELTGQVTRIPEGSDIFVAATDTFAGGSGGAIYNANLELVGHQVLGLADWDTSEGCVRAARVSLADANEQHQRIETSLRLLCDTGWPSSRLCGVVPDCGDGICTPSANENSTLCNQDCPSPNCGDKLCEANEQGSCPEDCNAFRDVPDSWNADPLEYQLSFGSPPGLNETTNDASPDQRPMLRGKGCSVRPGAGSHRFVLVVAGFMTCGLVIGRRRRLSETARQLVRNRRSPT